MWTKTDTIDFEGHEQTILSSPWVEVPSTDTTVTFGATSISINDPS